MAYPVLSITSLSKSFGIVRALSCVDLDVWPGEIVGVVGPAGAGKSTLLLCAAGIIKPSFGCVSILGRRISSDASPTEAVYVPPSPVFYPFLTVRDALSCYSGFSQCIDLSVDRMLLNNQLKQRIGTLDSGKVLCVALARAIVGRPRVLLLDAPMDRMDLPNARIARAAIIRAAEAVAAVIITSRDAGTLSGVSSRNVFMSDGQLLSTSDSMPKERPVTRVAERQH